MSFPRRNREIKYINPTIPAFDLPKISGSRYRASVPDTLDLAERAAEAVHGLTACTDPDVNAEIYWQACFGWKPIGMYHHYSDCCDFKFFAPSVLLRSVCGSDEMLEVEWHRMATLLQMQGPNGLMYTPLTGRPWGASFDITCDMFKPRAIQDHVVDVTLHSRMLEAAATYHAMTGDPQWDKLARRMVSGLRSMAFDQDDYAYFNQLVYVPDEEPVRTSTPLPPVNHGFGWVGDGLMTYYRMTGSEEALDLGYRLAKFYRPGRYGWVGPNGEFQNTPGDADLNKPMGLVHFHTNTMIRMCMLDAGIEMGDTEMVELAQAGYRYGRDNGESDSLMGYFPENLGPKDVKYMRKSLETCEIADMIYLALRQSVAGLCDCWDDVDRWVRNSFAELQLLETDWAYEYSEKYGQPKADPLDPPYTVVGNVPERYRGTWAGWAWPNDWQGNPVQSVMACCVGNAANQLYHVWRDMMRWDGSKNRLSVHLLLNRASSWADINSHIPYRGQVDVHLKRDCELALRIPEWTVPEECRVTVNGKDRTPIWDGRYAVVRGGTGETVTLQCPITERTETLHIVEKDYKVIVRGNEIVDIDPPGEHHPLYRRAKYRTGETQWRTVERFISDEIVDSY